MVSWPRSRGSPGNRRLPARLPRVRTGNQPAGPRRITGRTRGPAPPGSALPAVFEAPRVALEDGDLGDNVELFLGDARHEAWYSEGSCNVLPSGASHEYRVHFHSYVPL